jgi:hypothetical protein
MLLPGNLPPEAPASCRGLLRSYEIKRYVADYIWFISISLSLFVVPALREGKYRI